MVVGVHVLKGRNKMIGITQIECEIKKLQHEKAEILKFERMKNKKIEMETAISRLCIKNLDGMTKDKAHEFVIEKILTLCKISEPEGAKEVFGYNNNLFLATSVTNDDIKKDYFLIDLIILNVGINLFKKLELIKGKSDRQAKNTTKRFYEKLGGKKIVRYLKENYPIK